MKFLTALAFLGLSCIAQSSLIQERGDYGDDDYEKHYPSKTYDPYPVGVTDFPKKFAIGAKVDGKIYIVNEIDDGQIEFGPDEYKKPKKKWSKHPKKKYSKHDWKRSDDDEDEDDYDSDDEDYSGSDYLTFSYYQGLAWFKLKNSVLTDKKGRIGEIVANHQFQFDDAIQPDALYSKGWSIVKKYGYLLLAINGKTKFYDSAVDSYGLYKVYDEPITNESREIKLIVIPLHY
ncbi:hypothetical protein KGF54_000050 [Candida jiufengensis]|uniref:uncharacterized protein n=1 Tax=Candida jiufengensis TaxID=497108 RepID=UPI0022255C0F|nr:uncharacterized protein KGF54_000050 [Candida jiufengensis]KAI5957122.1 hypothetical protein KGF54_000050 [Candida jiufengensis]